ncbi:hypothetical protein ETD86_42880 [Nonomuraea turkmeniaca]|uniref:Uncharacterized protein n=1 Tax=Nonomuraea turkmeniaca TaxID=103838 RepID=A0A5S4FKI4_9ACTN|nr:hypothetical protein [Nonomuraea turkmeniaca]TMR09622.1 hypothetical protein ETD86_42880 [Nonomuraea turkmeniaca]
MDRTHHSGYTPATETRRLIAHGLPKVLPETLGGRHRFSPLSLYVGDRLATTAFARLDDVGRFWLDVWLLSQNRGGRWILRDGTSSAAGPADDLLAPSATAMELNGHGRADGAARSDINAGRWLPWPAKWVAYAVLRLSAEVSAVRFEGRTTMVPEHGLQVLAWAPGHDQVASVELLDQKGEPISTLPLTWPG